MRSNIRTRPAWLLVAAIALIAIACNSAADGAEPTPTATATPEPTVAPTEVPATPEPTPTPLSNFDACVLDVERRPELTWVINKTRPLPDGYAPDDLVVLANELVVPGFEGRQLDAETAEHFADLIAAAADEGFDIRTRSTYRSFEEQTWTFAYWVEQLGQEQAERVSAMPGHSEHQLGTTADVATAAVGWQLSEALGTTPEGIWLFENAYRFGFAESYPIDGEPITGYSYEPWHLRYIGIACATTWHESDLTLVEFLEALEEYG